jgi:hypothetical protein
VWEQNIETLRFLHRSSNERPDVVRTMVSHLRACAVDLVKRASNGSAHDAPSGNGTVRPKIDKSALTISEPKRIRCKEHLRFVASQPCLICGRMPSHAHHVRYAQSRGVSLKVSDEFTVPLCAIHHHHIHTTGNEREWWRERNIDPVKIAVDLWDQSGKRNLRTREAALPARIETIESARSSEQSAAGDAASDLTKAVDTAGGAI